jgi:hypothetical protein
MALISMLASINVHPPNKMMNGSGMRTFEIERIFESFLSGNMLS